MCPRFAPVLWALTWVQPREQSPTRSSKRPGCLSAVCRVWCGKAGGRGPEPPAQTRAGGAPFLRVLCARVGDQTDRTLGFSLLDARTTRSMRKIKDPTLKVWRGRPRPRNADSKIPVRKSGAFCLGEAVFVSTTELRYWQVSFTSL